MHFIYNDNSPVCVLKNVCKLHHVVLFSAKSSSFVTSAVSAMRRHSKANGQGHRRSRSLFSIVALPGLVSKYWQWKVYFDKEFHISICFPVRPTLLHYQRGSTHGTNMEPFSYFHGAIMWVLYAKSQNY